MDAAEAGYLPRARGTAYDAVDGSRHRHRGAKLGLLLRNHQRGSRAMNEVTTIGLDLANASGRAVVCRQLRRSQVLPFFERQAACLVGIEACAHLASLGAGDREVRA